MTVRNVLALAASGALLSVSSISGCGAAVPGRSTGPTATTAGLHDAATAQPPTSPAGSQLSGYPILDTLVATSASFETVPGDRMTLQLSSVFFTVTTGCNTTSGQYAIEDGRFMTTDVLQTLIGCAAYEREDSNLRTFFGYSPGLTIDGDTWTFSNSTDTMVFVKQDAT